MSYSPNSTGQIASLLRANRFAAVTSAAFDLADVRLRWFKGSERLGEPFAYQARIASGAPLRNFARILGQSVTVGMKLDGSGIRYFNGIITQIDYIGLEDTRRPHYELQIRPWLSLLGNRRNSRVFQNMTSVEIASILFREHGGTFENRSGGRLPLREYCVQHDETDLVFISRLLEQDGIYYYFRHAEEWHDLVLVDNAADHQPCQPQEVETHANLRDFRQFDDIFWRWREVAELTGDRVALDDYDPGNPAAELLSPAPVPPVHTGGIPEEDVQSGAQRLGRAGRGGTAQTMTQPGGGTPLAERFHYPGRYCKPRDGAFYAALRAEEIACRAWRAHMVGSPRQVTLGSVFKAANPFHIADQDQVPPPDERFMAVAITFELMGEVGEAGRGESGDPKLFYQCDIEAVPADTQFRPPLSTPWPVAGGPQTAVVVGRGGETITTDQFARIKVQFYWDREGKHDESSSCWVRVAQNWAGKGYGGVVIPRIGQEVVVDFLHGDPDRPLVIGAVYNGANLPPEILPKHATRSTFQTRTEGSTAANAFNQLRFEDLAGAETVHLHAQRNHTVDVTRLYSVIAGYGAAISAVDSSVLECAAIAGSPLGSRIELTQDGIVISFTGLTGQQSITLGPEGIVLQGLGISLISKTPVLSSPAPMPLLMPLPAVEAATLALRLAAVEAQGRRVADVLEAKADTDTD